MINLHRFMLGHVSRRTGLWDVPDPDWVDGYARDGDGGTWLTGYVLTLWALVFVGSSVVAWAGSVAIDALQAPNFLADAFFTVALAIPLGHMTGYAAVEAYDHRVQKFVGTRSEFDMTLRLHATVSWLASGLYILAAAIAF